MKNSSKRNKNINTEYDPNTKNNKKPLIITVLLILIILITFISFYPSLSNGFTNWDDTEYVTENPVIFNLNIENIKNIFDFTNEESYRTNILVKSLYVPLTMLSFAVDHHFFKFNPFGYHLTNLILHLFNTIFVFWFIYLLRKNIFMAFFVSLLFGIHPMHVESVAWITERKDVLYSFFFLLSLISYVYYVRKNHIILLIITFILFTLSLLSKPMAITLPVLLILIDFYEKRKFEKKTIFEKIPFFILSFIEVLISFKISSIYKTVKDSDVQRSFFYGVGLAGYGFLFYIKKMFAPVNLSPIYPHTAQIKTFSNLPLFFKLSPAISAGIIGFFLWFFRKNRDILFGLLFFLIVFAPVSQIIAIPPGIAADRYFYISSIGLFYILAVFFNYLIFEKFKSVKIVKILFFIFLIFVTCIFSYMTNRQCLIWKDSISLWSAQIKNYPYDTDAYSNRTLAYTKNGDFSYALNDCNTSIKLAPYLPNAYNNRAVILIQYKKLDDAMNDLNTAIKLSPLYAEAYANKGSLLIINRKYDQALQDINYSLKLNPKSSTTWNKRATLYIRKNEYDNAIKDLDVALWYNPSYSAAYNAKGAIYFNKKEYQKAIEEFNNALLYDRFLFQAYYNRAMAYYKLKDFDSAVKDMNMTIQTNPKFTTAYVTLGIIYYDMGLTDKAINSLNTAVKQKPEMPDAYINLAKIYLKQGNIDKAFDNLEIIKKLGSKPDKELIELMKKNKNIR